MAKGKKGPGGRRRRATGRRRRRAIPLGLMSLSTPMVKMSAMKIGDLYRPLKKPVTLRLDADVIAWFKKDGRRYQSRINAALRQVMEGERKGK